MVTQNQDMQSKENAVLTDNQEETKCLTVLKSQIPCYVTMIL